MKKEPLKDKGRWANEDLYLEYAQCAIEDRKLKEHLISLWFRREDIKSAVEWLKDELHKWWDENPSYENLKAEIDIWIKIDKAFEDVISPKPQSLEKSQDKNPMHYCLNCEKYIGERGFCSKECHDKWYDREHPTE